MEGHSLASEGPVRRVALRLVILAALVVAGLIAVVEPAHAQPVTIQKSGSYGYWAGSANANNCGNLMGSYVQPIEPYLTRSPSYPNHTQTIYMTSRIDYWTGTVWAVYKWDPWQSHVLQPGVELALFSTNSQTVSSRRYYRVVQFYEWWVNGVRVGSATNLFDQSDYFAAWVAPTGTAASYCYIY
jgi:hypothetical protein